MTASEEHRVFGGRYETIRTIGAGGMGRVFLVRDRTTGAQAALKTLLPRLAGQERSLERFRREASVMGRLDHPHVVRVFDFGTEDDGTAYLVMEHLDGPSLLHLVKTQGAFEAGFAARLGAQIASALGAAHALGIVHRDIKPSNVVLAGGVAKVIDFGLAAIKEGGTYQRLTQTGQLVGTPGFMAPEQLQGGVPDARTDIYALGATLWGLLAGRPPYPGAADGHVLVRVLRGEKPHLTDLRPDLGELAAIVERAMSIAPAHRFGSAKELEDALASWDPSEASPAPPTLRTPEQWTPPPTAFRAADTDIAPPGDVAPTRSTKPRPKRRTSALRLSIAIAAACAIALVSIPLVWWIATDDSTASVAGAGIAITDAGIARDDTGVLALGPAMQPRDAGLDGGERFGRRMRSGTDAGERESNDPTVPVQVLVAPLDHEGNSALLQRLHARNRAAVARCWERAYGFPVHLVLTVNVVHYGTRAELHSLSSSQALPNLMHCVRLLFVSQEPWGPMVYRGRLQFSVRR